MAPAGEDLRASSHLALTWLRFSTRLARRMTDVPAFAKRRAVEAPIPEEAPVIKAVEVEVSSSVSLDFQFMRRDV